MAAPAELNVLVRVVELLAPQFDKLAHTMITRREEFGSGRLEDHFLRC